MGAASDAPMVPMLSHPHQHDEIAVRVVPLTAPLLPNPSSRLRAAGIGPQGYGNPTAPYGPRPRGGDEIAVVAQDADGSLKLGGHLVDAGLGAVVVLARRPGHANRTNHIIADLNWQTSR
jgi:hypothetical protein